MDLLNANSRKCFLICLPTPKFQKKTDCDPEQKDCAYTTQVFLPVLLPYDDIWTGFYYFPSICLLTLSFSSANTKKFYLSNKFKHQ